MRRTIRHAALLCALLTVGLRASASPEFKGFAGFLGNLTVKPNGYYQFDTEQDSLSDQIRHTFDDPMLGAQGYFGAQVQFQDTLILRTEFSVRAKDLIGESIVESPFRQGSLAHTEGNALLQIQEASAVYKLQTDSLTHFLSAFYGEYEPIGSDVFLQRQFGIAPIQSDLTTSFNSMNGIAIHESYGAGLSYVARSSSFQRPVAAGAYLFRDWNGDRGATNADVRIGGAFNYVTFDLRAGFSLPDSSGEDKFSPAEYASLNAGLSILGGKQTSVFNVFLQAGFSNLILDPRNEYRPHRASDESDSTVYTKLAAESLYFLLEPRVNLRQAKFSLTAFNIPYSQASKIFYLNNYNGGNKNFGAGRREYWQSFVNPCGIDLHASTNILRMGTGRITTGLHLTLSLGGLTAHDMYEAKKDDEDWENPWDTTVFVSPYAKLPLHGGEVYAAATVSSQIFKGEDNWPSCVSVKAGFKISF